MISGSNLKAYCRIIMKLIKFSLKFQRLFCYRQNLELVHGLSIGKETVSQNLN